MSLNRCWWCCRGTLGSPDARWRESAGRYWGQETGVEVKKQVLWWRAGVRRRAGMEGWGQETGAGVEGWGQETGPGVEPVAG